MPDPSIVAPVGVYYPDLLAPDGQNLYVFGFVDVTDIAGLQSLKPRLRHGTPSSWRRRSTSRVRRQISAPTLYCNDGDDIRIKLENLGLAVRPDLFDPHTIHWHGFANQIPYFDGVPTRSLSVPSGSEFTYGYLPVDVGTYMYHCHVEDVEHVHMGLTGMVFIRPHQDSPRGLPRGSRHADRSTPTTTRRPSTTASTRSCSPKRTSRTTGTTATSKRATGASTARRSV